MSFQTISASEVAPGQVFDTSLMNKIRVNQDHFNSANFGMGYSLKDFVFKEEFIKRLSFSGSLQPSGAVASASGSGVVEVIGTGEVVLDELFPVNIFLGIGGFCVAQTSGTSQISFGVKCYDEGQAEIGTSYFQALVNLPNGSWGFQKGVKKEEGVDARNLPVGTRFVKPVMLIVSTDAPIYLDSMGIFPLNFANQAYDSLEAAHASTASYA